MSILADRIKAAFADREVSGGEVKLPDGTTIKLYAKPITALDITVISKKYPEFTTNPSVEATVALIVRKAMDESGELAFQQGDIAVLKRMPMDFITEVKRVIFPDEENDADMSDEALEDTEKN